MNNKAEPLLKPRLRRRLFFATVVALAALLVFLRPGVDHSPWTMFRLFHADVRVENFRRMERVFPVRELQPAATPHVFSQRDGILPATYPFNGEDRHIGDFLTRTQTTGLMVLKQGAVVHEEYRLGADASSRFTSWSVAKSVVATLVGIAVKEGKIRSLDDTVASYVPGYAGTAWANVRVRDLLRMASGIEFSEVYDAQFSDIQRVFHKTYLLGQPIDVAVRDYPAAASERPPGSRFHYISIDTQVLANVLHHATGEALIDYAQTRLWQPLGMQDTALWNVDGEGTAMAFCCLNTTLRDYAKLGQLYLQDGNWNGQSLLPSGWVRESTQRPEPWLAAGSATAERGYGYHWWVPPAADGEFFANGIWGQVVWVDAPRGVVIVRTAVDPDFEAHTAEMIAAMRGIAAGLP
jgi:CubicO group peptidase (beta-lactamase class C family)